MARRDILVVSLAQVMGLLPEAIYSELVSQKFVPKTKRIDCGASKISGNKLWSS